MNTKLARLHEFRDDVLLKAQMETARRVCLDAMDRRSVHVIRLTNIYFKALHAYRVELRRVRKKGEPK